MKIPKWQHKLARDYKREKLVSYFLKNTTKTYLYRLKISDKLKLSMSFSLKHFFISVAISTKVASAPLRNLKKAEIIEKLYFQQIPVTTRNDTVRKYPLKE